MTLPELWKASTTTAGENWPALVGAFLGAALSQRMQLRRFRRALVQLRHRVGRVETFLSAHFKWEGRP